MHFERRRVEWHRMRDAAIEHALDSGASWAHSGAASAAHRGYRQCRGIADPDGDGRPIYRRGHESGLQLTTAAAINANLGLNLSSITANLPLIFGGLLAVLILPSLLGRK
jgi:hypothetical protein